MTWHDRPGHAGGVIPETRQPRRGRQETFLTIILSSTRTRAGTGVEGGGMRRLLSSRRAGAQRSRSLVPREDIATNSDSCANFLLLGKDFRSLKINELQGQSTTIKQLLDWHLLFYRDNQQLLA